MGINIPELKKRQEAARANRGDFWKPVADKNTIRVFTFKHKVMQADVKAGLFGKAQEGKTVEELERVITRQFMGVNRAPPPSRLWRGDPAWTGSCREQPRSRNPTPGTLTKIPWPVRR